jgi:aminoglycoside phosphotransferase (APT) family kinase protein
MTDTRRHADVVVTADDAAAQALEPLLILEPLAAFLDTAGLGSGPVSAHPIGAGHSNVTYRLDRGSERFCLRRPPRGPLPRSAHDVLREARLQIAVSRQGVRTPDVLAICEDPELIGAPFYIMRFLEGHVLEGAIPDALAGADVGERIAEQLVDRLVELHGVDAMREELAGVGRPSGYLGRQIERFAALLADNATRPLPQLETVTDWLADNRPDSRETTVVHGDYRLGNVMFGAGPPIEIIAVLDWEMATLGDPLADLGYLTAVWAEPDDPSDPMLDLSPLTRRPGFPSRAALAARYSERTGRGVAQLRWYQTLALWKAAIFLESSYARYKAGTTDDPYFASLEAGVPRLAERALGHSRDLAE